ncbi:MAG: helix-turn-helix transcriptional regulator [Atopobiaceae bacterium]|nr:helix-turn-helix transcriptional regulator [Atopobiaceae bacterium]
MSRISFAKLRLPGQAKLDVAKREKERRKRLGLTQVELAKRADVSLGSLRRFEQTGGISFASLVNLCYALNCQDELEGLFSAPAYRTIQEVIDEAR